MSEVVGGDSVRLEKNEVLVVLGDLHIALDKIGELDLLLGISVCEYAEHEGVALCEIFLDLFHSYLPAREHFCASCLSLSLPVGVLDLSLLINAVKLLKLLLGSKAGISLALANELLCVGLIYICSQALLVRTVNALVANTAVLADDRALVKFNSVGCKSLYKSLSGTRHLALSVGVLDSQIKHAAALMSKALCNCCGEKSAEVNESRGAGSKSRYLSALGELSLGKSRLHILGKCADVGEEKLCKLLIV